MFLGHYALALGAKKYTPSVSLGVLFLACQLADLLWPNLVLLGLEKVEIEPGITVMNPMNFLYYPWSHSLVALLLWAVIFALAYTMLRRVDTKTAVIIAMLVLSHWVLDVVTHRPDMPLTFSNQTLFGLGLWNFPLAAVVTEFLLLALGIWIYVHQTKPLNLGGSLGFWALIIFLIAIYTVNQFVPPPPSATALAWSAQALWLLVFWGFWVDRNREPQ